jgi:translation initiation factor IF-3
MLLRRAKRRNTAPPRPRVTARTNEEIDAGEVRVVGEDGQQIGVMELTAALERATDAGLDLVEVAGSSAPPVCRLMDYGKWRYEEERKLRAARRNQMTGAPKEVRLRPRISGHDYEWKKDRAADFLRARSKVKLVVLFRGREREHPEIGRELLDRLAADVGELATAEGRATLEGRTMTVVLAPNGGSS